MLIFTIHTDVLHIAIQRHHKSTHSCDNKLEVAQARLIVNVEFTGQVEINQIDRSRPPLSYNDWHSHNMFW